MPSGRKVLSIARSGLLAAVSLGVVVVAGPAVADSCPASQFSREVDAAGEALRSFNTSMAPELQRRIGQLKAAKGWSDAEAERLAQDYLFDARIAGLDRKANDLLTKIDELGGQGEAGGADCSKLDELKATGVELLAVMKAKSSYTLAKIDDEIATGRGVARPQNGATAELRLPEGQPREFAAAPKATEKPKAGAAGGTKPAAARPKAKKRPAPAAAKQRQSAQGQWETTTAHAPDAQVPRIEVGPDGNPNGGAWGAPGDLALNAPPPGDGEAEGMPPPSGMFTTTEEGYTLAEIRDATRGFFGTISTNLASVIEHAFSQWGQPTGYILGKEGGGAFLAGVRYGEGTLFMRSGARRKVYWHGPSLGYDIGAEGSRTLFLVYSLTRPEGLYRAFTGVDGSAYLVGGVGVTLLKGGPVVLAPIRSGVGLRLGANIGYIRFSREASWNPF